MLSIGMVGCGAVAHMNYAQTLIGRRDYAVKYVFDLNAAQAQSAANLYGAEMAGLDELIVQSDAIIVTTPPNSHAEIVNKSLKAGKVVLCEKPFVVSHREAIDLVETARRNNASLYVGHFRRLFPQLRLARNIVAMGQIGDIVSVDASEGGRFTWKVASDYISKNKSGGVIFDTGAHTVDMVLYAACLDSDIELRADNVIVQKDRKEPSHHIDARFSIVPSQGIPIAARLRLSRKEALPCLIHLQGTLGKVSFSASADTRVRLTTAKGTVVLESSEAPQKDLMGFFDLQLRRIFSGDADDLQAGRFIGLTSILESLTHA